MRYLVTIIQNGASSMRQLNTPSLSACDDDQKRIDAMLSEYPAIADDESEWVIVVTNAMGSIERIKLAFQCDVSLHDSSGAIFALPRDSADVYSLRPYDH